jgi:predicted membrane protein
VTGQPRFTPQSLIGLLVIVIGVVFTLDNLGIAHWQPYLWRYWPAAILAIGLYKLWQSRDGYGGAFGGFLFTVVGAWLLLENLALVRLSFGDLWPLLLVCFGGYLVWNGVMGPRRRATADAVDVISATAIMGGVTRAVNSRSFRGGDLTAIMGGCEIDLRQASIDGEAVIEVFAIWGGIELKVPEDWTVVPRVTAIMAGVEDKTRPVPGAPGKRLLLRGFVMMAGVDVKN